MYSSKVNRSNGARNIYKWGVVVEDKSHENVNFLLKIIRLSYKQLVGAPAPRPEPVTPKKVSKVKSSPIKRISPSTGDLLKLVSCESVDSILSAYAHYQNILTQEKKVKQKKSSHD